MYDSHSGSTPGWRHPRLQTGTNLIKYIFQTLISHLVGATTKQKGTTAVADGWCFLILISVLFLFSGFGGFQFSDVFICHVPKSCRMCFFDLYGPCGLSIAAHLPP